MTSQTGSGLSPVKETHDVSQQLTLGLFISTLSHGGIRETRDGWISATCLSVKAPVLYLSVC